MNSKILKKKLEKINELDTDFKKEPSVLEVKINFSYPQENKKVLKIYHLKLKIIDFRNF